MIHTLTLNPALDKTAVIPNFRLDTVNRIQSLRMDPGGKGINVSKVLHKMGAASRATALLGGGVGQYIRDELERQGIEVDAVFVPGETRTNFKIIDPETHTNTDINEPGRPLAPEQADRVFRRFTEQLREGDLAVLSGSVPAGTPNDIYARYIRACQARGAKVFLDADGPLFSQGIQTAPYLVKPNQDELSHFAGTPLTTLEEIRQAACSLLAKGIVKVVVSMGNQGALYVTRETCLYAPALSVPVSSTVGAGDSVVAALALAEEQRLSPEQTLALAIATGAANVMCSGTQAADYSQIKALLPLVRCQRL